jgi:hypothetical protein
MEGHEKTGRGPTRPLEARLAEIKRKVARIEKSQTQAGQKQLARSRILVGLAALEMAEREPDFAAELAKALRGFCKLDRDKASVAALLLDLDKTAQSAKPKKRGFFG